MIPKSPVTKMRGDVLTNYKHPMLCKRCGKPIKKAKTIGKFKDYIEVCQSCLNGR